VATVVLVSQTASQDQPSPTVVAEEVARCPVRPVLVVQVVAVRVLLVLLPQGTAQPTLAVVAVVPTAARRGRAVLALLSSVPLLVDQQQV
jgi:hypothetical protein